MFLTALIFGFLGSLHCVGMCGPIAFMLPVDRVNRVKRILQIFIYHLGRSTAYAILGFLFGLLGKGFYLFGFQQYLSILVGIIMILIIVLPSKTINKFSFTKPIYRLLSKVKNKLGKELKKQRTDTFFTIGFLNGFLPCGLVYMAVFGAVVTGTVFEGGMYMLFFGLGTIPLMTAFVLLGNFATVLIRKKIQQIIPIAVVIVGVLFVLRGLGLGIPYISPVHTHKIIDGGILCH